MKTEEVPKTAEAKKLKQTELLAQEFGGGAFVGIDLPWRGSIKTVARQIQFFDQILALAELPNREQWPTILRISKLYGIPSIWNRVHHSPLELNAAALLTALAFSNRKDWARLILAFFKAHKLTHGLRGRPKLSPRERTDSLRGIQIDGLITKLREGHQIKLSAKRKRGFASGDEQVAEKLSDHGYNDMEIKAILESKTLQDAACHLYLELHKGEENVSLMAIRNSYARYKCLRGPNPPPPRRSSKTGK